MTITSSFDNHSTALDVVSGHDLTGKTAIITGGASGIGVETARALLTAGAEVIIAVRDLAKGEAVAQILRESTGNPRISTLMLDLSSLASARAAATQALQKWPRLDILINNAGIMATPHGHTIDGFEQQFGTNHLGHFAFATLLLPALRTAAPSRVVALSSSGHRRSDVHFDDLDFQARPYNKWDAYGQSKTADALFAVGLTQRYAAEGITANAVDPGGIQTGLQKFIPREEWVALGWMDAQGNINPIFKTPEQGAATSIWAAVGHELDGIGGLYLEDCNESQPFDPGISPYLGYMPYALDPNHARQLWSLSEALISQSNI